MVVTDASNWPSITEFQKCFLIGFYKNCARILNEIMFRERNQDKDSVSPACDVTGASAQQDGNVAYAAECFVNRILDSDCCVRERAPWVRKRRAIRQNLYETGLYVEELWNLQYILCAVMNLSDMLLRAHVCYGCMYLWSTWHLSTGIIAISVGPDNVYQ